MSQRTDDRRKFHRVQVDDVGASISGLSVELQGLGAVELVDIGYGGAAFSQPKKARLSLTGDTVHLDFLLNGQKNQTLKGRVVRLSEEIFAVEFIESSQ